MQRGNMDILNSYHVYNMDSLRFSDYVGKPYKPSSSANKITRKPTGTMPIITVAIACSARILTSFPSLTTLSSASALSMKCQFILGSWSSREGKIIKMLWVDSSLGQCWIEICLSVRLIFNVIKIYGKLQLNVEADISSTHSEKNKWKESEFISCDMLCLNPQLMRCWARFITSTRFGAKPLCEVLMEEVTLQTDILKVLLNIVLKNDTVLSKFHCLQQRWFPSRENEIN